MAASRPAPSQSLNITCKSCHEFVPTRYCMCTSTPLYLCDRCAVSHVSKALNLMHQMIPIDVPVANRHVYRNRCEVFAAGKAELEQNLAKIDECCQDVAAAVDSVIAQLCGYRDTLVGELQAWKGTLSREIEESVYEVESSLAAEEVQLTGKYSEALRHFEAGNLVLLNYKVNTETIENCIKNICSVEYLQPKQPAPQLVLLTGSDVRLFNFQSCSWGAPVTLAQSIEYTRYSSYTLINATHLICCGGFNEKSQGGAIHTHRAVSLDQCPVKSLPNMNEGRGVPGVVHCERTTYVFGGDNGLNYSNTGEMLELQARAWTPLPGTMQQGRNSFNPCVSQRNIYLCGGYTDTIELFSLVTRSFQLGPSLQLPEESACVAWMDGEVLIIVSRSYRTRVGSAAVKHEYTPFCVNSGPVAYGDSFYWLDNPREQCVRARREGGTELESYKT